MLFQCYYSTGYSRREGHGEDPPAGGAATQRQGEAARRGETTRERKGRAAAMFFERRMEKPWTNPGKSHGKSLEFPEFFGLRIGLKLPEMFILGVFFGDETESFKQNGLK